MILLYIVGGVVLFYGIFFDIILNFKWYRKLKGGVWVKYDLSSPFHNEIFWKKEQNIYVIVKKFVIIIEDYTK